MKVTTDACLFGAWIAEQVKNETLNVRNVLDIGTGTALLSLMYAQKNPDHMIDAIEIEEDCFMQAKENAAGSPFAGNIHVLHGDAKTFQFIKDYDLIISNPPFYENEIRSADPKKNIAHHHEGLLLEELLLIIKSTLSDEGFFFLLLPYKRNREIKKLLGDFHLARMMLVRQSTGHDYFRIMLIGKLKTANDRETGIDEIAIWNDQQQYTEEFTALLRDYYLRLAAQG